MNKVKRNRLKNKEKIRQLKKQLTKKAAVVYETDTRKEAEIILLQSSTTTLKEEVKLLKAEINGLHRFISRANVNYDLISQSFNMPNADVVSMLSDGSLNAIKLDRIRFRSYENTNSPYGPSTLYMVGLAPGDNPSSEIQASFLLTPDVIRDFPIDHLVERNLKEILKTRKKELLFKEINKESRNY